MRAVISMLRGRLPEDWPLELIPDDGSQQFQAFDGLYRLEALDGTGATIGVAAKRLIAPNDVAHLRNQFVHGLMSDTVDVSIVAARYLSRSVQEKLASAGMSFLDATGNALVRSARPALYISERGADREPWRGPGRPRGTLNGEPAAKVTRVLLDFQCDWSVRDLVEVLGASTGSVYRVLEFLESEDLAARDLTGKWTVDDWGPLLRRWSADYQLADTSRVSRWIAVRGIDAFLDSVRGIDTKWIEKRRGMVEGLVCAVTGRQGLGVAGPPPRVRVRILDPQHRLAGLTDFAVRVDELTAVDLPMHTVIVTENLETFLALPEREGVVAIHGSGFAVDALTQLPWLADRRILYWGDLDSQGFAILNMARGRGLNVESVLMDADTLLAFRDLWVREPKSFTGVLSQLTATEAQTLSVLADEGYPRLEQERVPWDYALLALDTALGTSLS